MGHLMAQVKLQVRRQVWPRTHILRIDLRPQAIVNLTSMSTANLA